MNWSQTVSFSEAAFGSLSNENVYLCSFLLSFCVFEQEGRTSRNAAVPELLQEAHWWFSAVEKSKIWLCLKCATRFLTEWLGEKPTRIHHWSCLLNTALNVYFKLCSLIFCSAMFSWCNKAIFSKKIVWTDQVVICTCDFEVWKYDINCIKFDAACYFLH